MRMMKRHPTLEIGNQLFLQAMRQDFLDDVWQLAGNREVAKTLITIPYPFERVDAEKWISESADNFKRSGDLTFAIFDIKEEGVVFVGSVSLQLFPVHEGAELRFWIGHPYWNKGYATLAARAVVWCGFMALDLNRISARHMSRNPGSGRVLQKLGMHYEGRIRQAIKKWGAFEDIEAYGMLKSDFDYQNPAVYRGIIRS